jgi:AAA ATPase-like protein
VRSTPRRSGGAGPLQDMKRVGAPGLTSRPPPASGGRIPSIPLAGLGRKRTPPWPADVPCFGRDRELAAVDRALVAAVSGRGSAWLIEGPAGIGKSRFLRRAADLAARRGFLIRAGFAIEGSLEPLFPLLQLVDDPDRYEGVASPATTRPEGEGPIADSHPSIDLRILSLIGEIERAAEERPQCVVLDDVHQADAETLRAVRLLARRVPGRRIVLLSAARSGAQGLDWSRVGVELRGPLTSGQLRPITLGPLSEDARLRLAAALLGHSVDTTRTLPGLAQVLEASGGTPYFLTEMVNAFLERRSSSRSPGFLDERQATPTATPRDDPIPVPPAVRASIEERLGELSRSDRSLLRFAALLGSQFDAEALAAGLGRPVRDVAERLVRLSRHGWPLRQTGAGPRRYAFEHAVLHAVVRDDRPIPSADAIAHLARWWSTRRPDDPVTEARLRGAVGDTKGVVSCLRRAIQDRIRVGAVRSVPELLRLGEPEPNGRLEPDPALEGLYEEAIRLLRERWEWEAVRETVEALLQGAVSPDMAWQALCWRLEARASQAPARTRHEIARLQRQARDEPSSVPSHIRSQLGYLAAVNWWGPPHPRTAHRRITRALAALGGRGSQFEALRLRICDVQIALGRGRPRTSAARLGPALATLKRWRTAPAVLRVLLRQVEAEVAMDSDDLPGAMRLGRIVVRWAERHGSPIVEISARIQLGVCELNARLLTDALNDLRRGEELALKFDNRFMSAYSALVQAWCYVIEGNPVPCRQALERARRAGAEVDWPFLGWALATVGSMLKLMEGDPTAALSTLPPRTLSRSGTLTFAAEYYCCRARILEAVGNLRGAHASLRSALRTVRRVGVRVDRLEVYAQLADWHRRHGSPNRARLWEGQFQRNRSRLPSTWQHPWLALGQQGPRTSCEPRVPSPRSRPSEPAAGTRILRLLDSPLSSTPQAVRAENAYGLTESEIAERLMIPRSRLARALGRLRTRGIVERMSVRTGASRRRLFRYRLTPRGTAQGH